MRDAVVLRRHVEIGARGLYLRNGRKGVDQVLGGVHLGRDVGVVERQRVALLARRQGVVDRERLGEDTGNVAARGPHVVDRDRLDRGVREHRRRLADRLEELLGVQRVELVLAVERQVQRIRRVDLRHRDDVGVLRGRVEVDRHDGVQTVVAEPTRVVREGDGLAGHLGDAVEVVVRGIDDLHEVLRPAAIEARRRRDLPLELRRLCFVPRCAGGISAAAIRARSASRLRSTVSLASTSSKNGARIVRAHTGEQVEDRDAFEVLALGLEAVRGLAVRDRGLLGEAPPEALVGELDHPALVRDGDAADPGDEGVRRGDVHPRRWLHRRLRRLGLWRLAEEPREEPAEEPGHASSLYCGMNVPKGI